MYIKHQISYLVTPVFLNFCIMEQDTRACDFCGCIRDRNDGSVSFYSFPLQEEHRRSWIANMGRDADWSPCGSSTLCSAHFTPDCFESGSTRLHPNAIPTLFNFTQSTRQNTESIAQNQAASTESTCCDCHKRLQASEKLYQLKLAAAQLQIKEYKRNLAEESRKASQWQKRAIVLQSAIRAMKQRATISTTRKTSTPKQTLD